MPVIIVKPGVFNSAYKITVHQQVQLPKPSPNPVKQKQKVKEDASQYPSRPQAQITHRKSHAEEKPMKLNSTIQETDRQKVRILVLTLSRCGTQGKKDELCKK